MDKGGNYPHDNMFYTMYNIKVDKLSNNMMLNQETRIEVASNGIGGDTFLLLRLWFFN